MVAFTAREQIINKLFNELTEEQIAGLLAYIEAMQSLTLPEDYDEDNDPSVGFFSGSPDLSIRAKTILQAEFGLQKPNDEEDRR
jgi:hypothetical protein